MEQLPPLVAAAQAVAGQMGFPLTRGWHQPGHGVPGLAQW